MDKKNMKAEIKANWKKIALIGGGAVLVTISTVVLKKKIGSGLGTKQLKEPEAPRYYEDLCDELKKLLGDMVYEDCVWAEKSGEINMILTDLTTDDLRKVSDLFEEFGVHPGYRDIQAVLTLTNDDD